MTTFTLKQHEEDLKTLEKRLDSVERGVCDALNNDRFIIETASITNLAERIETLVVKYREIENENDNIKQLVEKYMEYESFLEKEIDESPSIHTSEKKAILLSAFEDFHRIQHQLSEVQHLKEYVLGTNANPIKDLKALELHVSKVEVNTGHLLQDCIIFKRNLDQFLDEYDVQTHLISQTFLAWNSALTEMENIVSNIMHNRRASQNENQDVSQFNRSLVDGQSIEKT